MWNKHRNKQTLDIQTICFKISATKFIILDSVSFCQQLEAEIKPLSFKLMRQIFHIRYDVL